jgi:imidazolonepropionase-like amidohydrolase
MSFKRGQMPRAIFSGMTTRLMLRWALGALCTAASIASLSATARQTLQPGASRGALSPGLLAVRHVSVIPMTTDTVLRDATVIVRDGRITAIGASSRTTVPRGRKSSKARASF